MSAKDNNQTNNNESPLLQPSLPHLPATHHPMQSVAVITVAGFGGAIAGLSMSRRGPPSVQHVQLSSQLPWLWALGCATFAGVIEFSTLVSPTRLLISTLKESDTIPNFDITNMIPQQFKQDFGFMKNNDKDVDSKGDDNYLSSVQKKFVYWDENATATLGDYALGGAFAGAMFKGSQIRPTANNATSSSSNGIPSISSSNYNDTVYTTTISEEGTMKQKRAIGKGKVLTLSNKNQYYSKKRQVKKEKMKNISSNQKLKNAQQVMKQGTETILKNGGSKASFVSGLGPGIFLGIIAGLIQIGIGRINDIVEVYESDVEQKEENGDHPMEENGQVNTSGEIVDQITHEVKTMSTDEIRKEIDRLQREGK